MKYQARKFVQRSYDDNDHFAKSKVMDYLISKGHGILRYKEDFGHDIVTERNGTIFYFEVEVKRNYPFTDRESFPFDSVSFLGRKERLHEKNPFFYVIVCKETEWAVWCPSTTIFKEQYKEQLEINTSDRTGADEMYRVPKELCKFFDTNG